MTDTEIIRTLAEREGWTWEKPIPAEPGWKSRKLTKTHDYLTSRDALAPVLAKMTDEAWESVHNMLALSYGLCRGKIPFSKFILTLPPRTIAEAVAKSLKG